MKNFVQDGKNISFTAGADIASGDPVVIGQLPGVAASSVANGAVGVAQRADQAAAALDGIGESSRALCDALDGLVVALDQ